MIERLTAALADRYRIEREIGAGGMATVFLAHDLKHDRDVAIKVLHPDLGAALGAERFLTEIRTTARLQHPHILPLLDSGNADSLLYYVMPLVTGETLRDRLAREQQLPVDDAILIAREVADALGYAHGLGVIHRDIKPENILLQNGHALVADFGIALAVQQAGGQRMTQTGLSLGTPQYMSPEQAMGEKQLDARSDLYALGAVTYEMLVGEAPFTGPSVQAVVARLITEEPRSITTQRKAVPDAVEAAVLRALEKLPADRFATAAEFAAALADERGPARQTRMTAAAPAPKRRLLLVAGVAAAILGGTLLGRQLAPRADGITDLVQASLELGDSIAIQPIGNVRLAISPSGQHVAFIGLDGRDASLWVRDLGATEARLLPGTQGAFAPFFSPDGTSIAFFTGGGSRIALKVVPVASGIVRTVLEGSIASFGGGDWGDDGNIYFTHENRGLARVPATGGPVTQVSRIDSAGLVKEHDYPAVLPGSRFAVVMLWRGSLSANRVGAIDLANGTVTELAEGSYARYMEPGYIVFGASDNRLLAASIDPASGTLRSQPVLVMQDVPGEASNGTSAFSVALNGTLIYQSRGAGQVGIRWVDRTGKDTPVDSAPSSGVNGVALSPDGSRIALSQSTSAGQEVWVKQLASGTLTRLSGEVKDADRPVWSPDGRFVAFLASRGTRRSPWMRRADGSDSARSLVAGSRTFDEVLFHPSNGSLILRSEGTAVGSRRLSVMQLGVDTVPRVLLQADYDHFAPVLSPDGRWLAYVSDESGAKEVFVRPFPNVDSAKIAISVSGGNEPLWRRDGKELFYRTARGEMFAVPVETGPRFAHSAPVLLFANPAYALQEYWRSYDITPDGSRFLMLKSGGVTSSSLNVIFNWRRFVDSLVPGRS